MSEILDLVQARHSTRVPFDSNRPIAKEGLRQILEAGRWAPSAHNMQNYEVVVVDDPRLLTAIENIHGPMSLEFLRENYPLLSFSEEELLRRKVGLLGTMFPPSWRTPNPKPEAVAEPGQARPAFPPTSMLLFVLYDPSRRAPASEGDFLGIISLGCLMENMWLVAQSLGIGCQIVSALAAGSVEKEVKSLLGIPESMRIAFTMRLGYPAAAPAKSLRVRRDIEDFTHHNRYNHKGLD
ncbi:MAG: nitroreductase family protein [Anaerolineales bacterium]|jgi:nitroreductase